MCEEWNDTNEEYISIKLIYFLVMVLLFCSSLWFQKLKLHDDDDDDGNDECYSN
jgi:hypothetical protein